MEAAVVVGAVVEVMGIIVLIVVVTMLSLAAGVVALKIAIMVYKIVIVVQLVVLLVETLDVVIIDDMFVVGIMRLMRDIMYNGMVVVGRHARHLLEVRSTVQLGVVSLVVRDGRGSSSLSVNVLSIRSKVVVLTSAIDSVSVLTTFMEVLS